MTAILTVADPGLLTCLQDHGRPGRAAIGVPESGAFDRAEHDRANTLCGNDSSAATLEITAGPLVVTTHADIVVAVTGAPADVTTTDPHARPATGSAFRIRAGNRLTVRLRPGAQRGYVAVRGGVRPAWRGARVFGSLSTDLLSGLGPAPLASGDDLDLDGRALAFPPSTRGWARQPQPGEDVVTSLPVLLGPRDDELTPAGRTALLTGVFTVDAQSSRVGLRLAGPRLTRRTAAELPSEGMVTGGVQVPPSGQPVVFGPDHPTTGGYPVVAVVTATALSRLAQLAPGRHVRFEASV